MRGAYNVIYQVDFSDGLSWVVRVPLIAWNAFRARTMHHDMVALRYILDHTSLPIPKVHAYDCGTENILEHPYIIMDYVHGTRLIDVWNEPSWWTGERSKQRTLRSIARHMVELSTLEFDKIGCLDIAPDGSYKIVPFLSPFIEDLEVEPPEGGFGPFDTTYAYLLGLLDARLRERPYGDTPAYKMLRLFIGSLPDMRYDSAPFTLSLPDFDSQNIIVDDSGDVAAFVDWDWVSTQPRQLGALTYPAWLTIDWDPFAYDSHKDHVAQYDSQAELHKYREMYVHAVDEFSGGRLGEVVRNSHVVAALANALHSVASMFHIVCHVGEYVFGDRDLVFRALDCMERSVWQKLGEREIARIEGEFQAVANGHDGGKADCIY